MSDKELIKQEIERLKHTSNAYDRSRFMLLLEIEKFIDSLPEEPASEDLEEAASKYVREDFHERSRADFKAGAEWQKQQMKETLSTEYEKGRFDMQQEMMKDAVEGEAVYQIGSAEIAPTDIKYKVVSDRVYIPNVKLGDKVKIIIIKPEQ